MSKSPAIARRKKIANVLASAARKGKSKVLSFSDLEIPVEALLTKSQELKSGRRIRVCLDRLIKLLPLHPMGYHRFLARMVGVREGAGLMFSWLSLRNRMATDYELASKALLKAEALASKQSKRAVLALKTGAKILLTYTLDPETLTQWSREVLTLRPKSTLFQLEYFRKVERILRKVMEALETERERLVMPNFRLVMKEVFRYQPSGMRRSDLFQEGVLGLQKAVYRYDATRDIRFSTYATYWIRQSIRKSLIDKSRMIRVPQAVQEELRKVQSTMNPVERERVRKIMGETVLFSYGESEDSSDRHAFDVKDSSHPELGEELHTGVIPNRVQDALKELNSRERDIVQRRFGLAGERAQTLEEIGVQLKLSRERIRQIEQEALARMRRSQDLMEVYEDLDTVVSGQTLTRN